MANRIYARIADGAVAELVTLDDTFSIADAFHPSLQFVDVTTANPMPAQGWLYSAGAFSAPATPSVPPDRQMLLAAMAGLAVTSTGTPAISATYHATGDRWQMMRDEAQYIATFNAFSGGIDTLDWQAISGQVEFAATAPFLTVTRAVADWLTGWQRFVDGKIAEPPAGAVTIA